MIDKDYGGGEVLVDRLAKPVFGGPISILLEGYHLESDVSVVAESYFRWNGDTPTEVGAPLSYRALHFEVDEALEFDGVLHRELADEFVDEAVDG